MGARSPAPITSSHATGMKAAPGSSSRAAGETARHGGQSFFGSVEPGVQLHGSCHLLLIRESEEALKRMRE